MGDEIAKDHFEKADFDRFQQRLAADMQLLREWFEGRKFYDNDRAPLQFGLELEGWLLGLDHLPVPDNSLFLATLDRKGVVPELSKFNFELNVLPQSVAGQGLRDMQSELSATWTRCAEVAQRLEHRILSIGILPTVTDSMLCPANMSPLKRYAALNEQVLRLRGGEPLLLHIEGEEQLRSSHRDLMLESAATSVQVHLKVPQRRSVRFYNASVIASAVTVAMAANAPLLFGRRLWQDTRIPLFEQAVDTAGVYPRVSFGRRYLEDDLLELFEDNFNNHRVLLPVEIERGPARMPYARMHNGTIWNWNRALIGFEPDGMPHLRIEHRPMSASPSLRDLFADVALYLGLAQHLASLSPQPESSLTFTTAKENFYSAARYGLQAEIKWLDGQLYRIPELLLGGGLLENALEALAELGVATELIALHAETLRGRLETEQNGACWQLRKFAGGKLDLAELVLEYERNQQSGLPVHLWS